MPRKTVKKSGSRAAVPSLHATGRVKKFSIKQDEDNPKDTPEGVAEGNEFCHVEVDVAEGDSVIRVYQKNEVFELTWNARRLHGGFIFIAKAWKGWRGCQRYRVQAHRLLSNGTLWRRIILYESKDGLELTKPEEMASLLPDRVKLEFAGDA